MADGNKQKRSWTRAALEMMFPQLEVNRIIPSSPETYRRRNVQLMRMPWRWIRRPLEPKQRQWVVERAPLFWTRWFIGWGAVTYASVKLGPPGGAFLYLGFVCLAAWTLLGVAIAQGLNRLAKAKTQD